MPTTPTCYDNPASILRDPACVSALSKDLHAHLKLSRRERQRCADRRCVTLKTVHRLEMEMDPHECDSPTGRKLNGLIQVPRLVRARSTTEGCRILANYRIAFEADEDRGVDGLDEAAGPGTLEGAVICLCKQG